MSEENRLNKMIQYLYKRELQRELKVLKQGLVETLAFKYNYLLERRDVENNTEKLEDKISKIKDELYSLE